MWWVLGRVVDVDAGGYRNLLPDTELVLVLKMVEGWMSSDTMFFSVLCRALQKSPIVAQVCTVTSTFLDYTDVPRAGSCFGREPCSIFINLSLGIMYEANKYHNQSSLQPACTSPVCLLPSVRSQLAPCSSPQSERVNCMLLTVWVFTVVLNCCSDFCGMCAFTAQEHLGALLFIYKITAFALAESCS